jgi:hypothetical protein
MFWAITTLIGLIAAMVLSVELLAAGLDWALGRPSR